MQHFFKKKSNENDLFFHSKGDNLRREEIKFQLDVI